MMTASELLLHTKGFLNEEHQLLSPKVTACLCQLYIFHFPNSSSSQNICAHPTLLALFAIIMTMRYIFFAQLLHMQCFLVSQSTPLLNQCNNHLLSSPLATCFYKSALSGILAVLYIIYCICMYYHISLGTVKYYCDNKGAVKNSFSTPHPGILPFMNSNYDLLHLIHQILHIIPVNIVGPWVKGHFVGLNPEVQHSLNEIANTLATTYQHNQPRVFTSQRLPIPPPNYKVRLIYDNSIITPKYYSSIVTALHNDTLKQYILCKTRWTDRVFHSVDWTSHSRAFNCLSRQQKIQTAKLIHNLANTNLQNHLYYGTSSACPGCQQDEETFEHVLTCSFPPTRRHRDTCIKVLESSLLQCLPPPHDKYHSAWLFKLASTPTPAPIQTLYLRFSPKHGYDSYGSVHRAVPLHRLVPLCPRKSKQQMDGGHCLIPSIQCICCSLLCYFSLD
jgi:hypothetical protein